MPPPLRSRHNPPNPGNVLRQNNAIDVSTRTAGPNQAMNTNPSPPPPPTGIDQLWDTITRSRNPDGSVLISAETFGILHVMIKDLQTVQTRLDAMAVQLERMDNLTRKVEELSTSRTTHNLPKKPVSWARVARNQTDPPPTLHSPNYRLSEPHPPPTNKTINKFQLTQVIIKNINMEKIPFEDKSTSEITDCINFALTTLDIKPIGASEPANVRSAVRLPNGDIKLYTATRSEAKCILEQQHEWAELANTDFKTTRPAYPVVLHSVPQQDMFDDTLIDDLTTHNNLPEGTILSYRWL